MHADKEPEPLNLGVPIVNFPRANAILARPQTLLWVRDWEQSGKVEYERGRLLGIAKKFINFLRFPASLRARIRVFRFAPGRP